MITLLNCKNTFDQNTKTSNSELFDCIVDLPAELQSLIVNLTSLSPYITSLIKLEHSWLKSIVNKEVNRTFNQILNEKYLGNSFVDLRDKLRVAKRRSNLLIILADFGGIWDLTEVTKNLSIFAERVLSVSLNHLIFNEFKRLDYKNFMVQPNSYFNSRNKAAEESGIIVLAMGKLGSYELNYSSDIDLIFLFDEKKYLPSSYSEIRSVFIKIVRNLVKLLSEVTDKGHVFRVDLRLRPDPSSNPICIGSNVAQNYYEIFGRNWERAALVKARPICGDVRAGKGFLKKLFPFVWRKNLDFEAVSEVNNIRNQMELGTTDISLELVPGHNIKTGAGGIREIEFFTQAQQLVTGGRDKNLRVSQTILALQALSTANWIPKRTEEKLIHYYKILRKIEHILQLIDDAQTHSVPKSAERLNKVAKLFGLSDRNVFCKYLYEILKDVHSLAGQLFSSGDQILISRNENSVVRDFNIDFLLKTYFEKWYRYRFLRSERAIFLFKSIEPLIVKKLLSIEHPEASMFNLDKFMISLSGGIQLLALFRSNPQILHLLIEICGAAPALADYLTQNPSVLDFVLDKGFYGKLPDKKCLARDFNEKLNGVSDYEEILNVARRWVKENQFRTGVHLLKGFSNVTAVAKSFSNIAEICLEKLFRIIHRNFAIRYGVVSGRGAAILAMGKLGSKEMSLGSDLDLIIIYDASQNQYSNGKKTIPSQLYYSKLTQAFISAITVATSEGKLFRVDMRLRPSGNKGTVATSVNAFEFYQTNEAWIWERLALSRGRVIAGDKALKNIINSIISRALNKSLRKKDILREVETMRARIQDNQKSLSYHLDPKNGVGRLQELELMLQMGGLIKKCFSSNAPFKKIRKLAKTEFLTKSEAKYCIEAYKFYFSLQQVLNIVVSDNKKKSSAMAAQNVLINHSNVDFSSSLEIRLKSFSEGIEDMFKSKLCHE